MIEQTYKSKRVKVYQPPKTYYGSQNNVGTIARDTYQSTQRKITVDEYRRREKIVQELFQKCPYKAGDIVYPKKASEYEFFGPVKVLNIVDEYWRMGKDEEWPKTDYPLIVSFVPVTGESKDVTNCTVNFLTVNNEHMVSC